jgi:hypothetical protein
MPAFSTCCSSLDKYIDNAKKKQEKQDKIIRGKINDATVFSIVSITCDKQGEVLTGQNIYRVLVGTWLE